MMMVMVMIMTAIIKNNNYDDKKLKMFMTQL